MGQRLAVVVGSALGLLAAACGAGGIEGDWDQETDDATVGFSISFSMSLEGDGTGTAMMRGVSTDGTISLGWDVDWEKRRDDEYELTFTCSSADVYGERFTCRELADAGLETVFSLYCETNGDGEELYCVDEETNRTTWRLR
jgi:hypothetical protein